MTADSQAEREVALGETRARLWFAGQKLSGEHIFYGGKGHEHFKPNCTCQADYDAAVTAHEDAARAEGADELAAMKRDLDTAEHNQDVMAAPFSAGGQLDQMHTLIGALEGALREAVRYLDTDTESWWSDKFEAKINRWRALLPFPAEGPEASEGDERG